VAYFEENLRTVLANLEECQAALIMNGDRDTAQLVSVAILELRIKLNRVEDSELKALCDAMLRETEAASKPVSPKSPEGGLRPRPPVTLKLVK
jgi:hypothetical protein